MIPAYWHQACAALASRDTELARIIGRYGGSTALKSRGDAFATLARSIVGQQISVKASESAWQRVLAALPDLCPHAVAGVNADILRSCGLSQRKVEYIQDLARHFLAGRLRVEHWPEMGDEEVICELCDVRGIGRWTAEMFLIFNLQRPDIFPVDDIGLQRAISVHYNAGQTLGAAAMRAIAKRWQPWRTVATWYLWRSLDPEPVEY
ncbi:MAG: DNA-3-methyladenine glycosylase [Sulfuricellaceae bacterium]|nr:DNA-3-methyladenine glycosylase [Sulfuricellaceae bacterium]